MEYQLDDLNRVINMISFSAPVAYKSLSIDRLQLVDQIDILAPVLLVHSVDSQDSLIAHWNQSTHLVRFLEDIQSNGINILRRKHEARRSYIAFQIAIVLTLLFSAVF